MTSVLKLFRVQDARAALPQNCSPKKIRRMQILAYGTFGLWGPPKCHLCKLLISKSIIQLFSNSAHVPTLKSCDFLPMNLP